MTDGPFKNSKLGGRLKRFAEAAGNENYATDNLCGLASDAIVNEILKDDANKAFMADLRIFENQKQLELVPASLVEDIFRRHNKTPFLDLLHKTWAFHSSDTRAAESAMSKALEDSVRLHHVGGIKNRIEEECIHAHESGKMNRALRDRTIRRMADTIPELNIKDICKAVYTGDRKAFKNAASKKKGLDEGPSL